jgi:hypothetical protein
MEIEGRARQSRDAETQFLVLRTTYLAIHETWNGPFLTSRLSTRFTDPAGARIVSWPKSRAFRT